MLEGLGERARPLLSESLIFPDVVLLSLLFTRPRTGSASVLFVWNFLPSGCGWLVSWRHTHTWSKTPPRLHKNDVTFTWYKVGSGSSTDIPAQCRPSTTLLRLEKYVCTLQRHGWPVQSFVGQVTYRGWRGWFARSIHTQRMKRKDSP